MHSNMKLKIGSNFSAFIRSTSTKPCTNGFIKPFIVNRNPRNLEMLRLKRKPTGFSVDLKDIEFWNRLKINTYNKYVTAQVVHHTNEIVVSASTNEWAIKKFLYSNNDKQAFIILARVFAERCLESGITNMKAEFYRRNDESNVSAFIKTLEEEGLMLEEAPYFDIYDIWRKKREKKPWTVLE